LRKESSSRKPLRHKNINEFSSDDIPKKAIKRKRYMKDEQVSLIISSVYITNVTFQIFNTKC